MRIGEALVAAGVVAADEIEAHLRSSPAGARLATTLLQNGVAPESALVEALGRLLGVPGVSLSGLEPDSAGLALVPAEVATRHCVLPLRAFARSLTLAMRDPHDATAIREVEFCSGRVVRPVVAVGGALEAAIEAAYRPRVATPKRPRPSVVPPPLPVRPEPVAEAAIVPGPERGARVDEPLGVLLVVDPDLRLRRAFEGALSVLNRPIVSCQRGEEALAHAEAQTIALAIVDADLEDAHGAEICFQLRTRCSTTARLILTSATHRGWAIEADLRERYGIDAVVAKPCDLGALVDRSRALLDGRAGPAARSAARNEGVREALDRAQALAERGDHAVAIAALRDIARGEPDIAAPYLVMGRLLERQGRPLRALAAYELAVAREPESMPALRQLAMVCEGLGLRRRARDAWLQALNVAAGDSAVSEAIRARVLELV